MKLLKTSEIIQKVVDQITPVVKIDEFIDNNNGTFSVLTCDTFYLIPCKEIEIDSERFMIESITQDQEIILKPQNAQFDSQNITSTEFPIYLPFFINGTPIMTNNELQQTQFDTDKTPMIWLYESLREKHRKERSFNPISLEADLVIFFVDSSRWADWNTDQHYQFVIDPMKALVNEFINVINKNRGDFDEVNEFDIIDRVNFGNQSGNGTLENYFNDELSGCELRFTMKYKKYLCDDCL